jgi:CRP-like cAMP-binding protein
MLFIHNAERSMRSPIPALGTEANRLLAALPVDVRETVLAQSEIVALKNKDVLYTPHTPIDYVYFPRAGCISVLSAMADGGFVEVGTIGWEGMYAVSLVHGVTMATTPAIVQVPGSAVRMSAEAFVALMQTQASFRALHLRYAETWMNAIGRGGSCNAVHPVEERCARWLLMTHDRVDGDALPLTQEFLGIMLGVRRASVTLAALALQEAGLINYRHGKIVVLDREGLEGASCECYQVIRQGYDQFFHGPPSSERSQRIDM